MGHYNIHFSPTGGTRRVADICPKGARKVDQNLWNMMADKMAPVLGGRKENHLFL